MAWADQSVQVCFWADTDSAWGWIFPHWASRDGEGGRSKQAGDHHASTIRKHSLRSRATIKNLTYYNIYVFCGCQIVRPNNYHNFRNEYWYYFKILVTILSKMKKRDTFLWLMKGHWSTTVVSYMYICGDTKF